MLTVQKYCMHRWTYYFQLENSVSVSSVAYAEQVSTAGVFVVALNQYY